MVRAKMSADTGATMADQFETVKPACVFDDVLQGVQGQAGTMMLRWAGDTASLSFGLHARRYGKR